MTGTVVVGVDGSAVAYDALRFAADEAARRSARLVIAHAGPEPGWSPEEPPAYELRASATDLPTESTEIATAAHPDLPCETVVRSDDPARLLIELSANADLVVVGTHRTGRTAGFVLGSVSQRVAGQAHCPVVAVSGAAPLELGPILLGASGSVGGLAALRFACAEARLRGVGVHCLRAITESAVPAHGMRAAQEVAEQTLEYLGGVAAFEYPDVPFVGELCLGGPFGALEDAARDSALVVLGTRQLAGEMLPHLGPIGSWLLHQTRCPLVIVNQAARRRQRRPASQLAVTRS
jgi:nucleotide-binding universal stress UspA family protein